MSEKGSRRRLLFEPLERRELLASLAVAANAAIFDTVSAAPHSEVSNIVAELSALGHTAATFSDLSAAGIGAALVGAEAVVIPEQEVGSLNGALSVAAKDVLRNYVSSGHGMIVIGSPSGRAESLLNGLFGFSIAAGADPAGASFLDDVDSVGTTFATGPAAVFNFVTKVTAFDASSFPAGFPAGTRLLYKFGSVRTVGLFPYGQGQIVYLGYDFDDPAGQPASANWKIVLGLAVDQVAVAPPTTSVEIVGGDLVISDLAGANDAFSLSADLQEWTIAIQSGKFIAPSPIPGVTVDEKTIVIDKSAAATFTGQFAFDGGGGNDVLTVQLDELGRDVHFDGGEFSIGDHDVLEVASTAAVGSLTSTPDASGGGAIDVASDGDAEITYAGLEPVDLTGIAVQELHFVVPPAASAELIDYLAPTDGFSQLRFLGTGPEDQFFRHPSQRLAIHTLGGSLVSLFPLDPTASLPALLLDGDASDVFRFGATSGIRSRTSLTLVNSTLDLNGQSPVINGLSGTGIVTNAADTNSVLTVGADGGDGDFSGTIADGWPAGALAAATRQVSLVKAGAGTQRLSALHTYSGTTNVEAGTLVLDGSLSLHSSVTVRDGATLSGIGAIDGSLALESGGTIEPGSPGSQPGSDRGRSETWRAGGRFAVQLGGTVPGSGHDQRRIAGSLSLENALLDVSLFGGFVPTQQPPVSMVIVDNAGPSPVAGAFLGLPEGAAVNVPGSPVPLLISYQGGDGNDIVLFTVADVSQNLGTDGDDTLVLRRQGPGVTDSELAYSLNGGPFISLDDVDSLSVDTGHGADVVILDFVYGDPVPPDGLQIDGGDEPMNSVGDRLVLLGRGDATEVVYRPDGSAAGQGFFDLAEESDGTIELSGLEAIDATALAQVTLAATFPDNHLVVEDALDVGTETHPALRISGTSGLTAIVPLHVWSIGSLALDTAAGGGDDSVLIVSAAGGHEIGDLRVSTGAGSDRTIVGATNVAGDLLLQSGEILIGGRVTAGGSIDATSRGLMRIDAPLAAGGPVTLTTTDEPGLDADLSVEAEITSQHAGLTLRSADNAMVRAPLTAATTIDIGIDTANNDPGEGGTLFLQTALTAPAGATATGNSDADRFEIEPQASSALLIRGELPGSTQANAVTGNATRGDAAGDLLVLDMTTTGAGELVLGPVVVDTVGGRATAANTLPVVYRSIEALDLYDDGALTTTQQGDFYLRGTDADESIGINTNGQSDPSFRISVGSRALPENSGWFGPYGRGRSLIVFGRGGRDSVNMSSAPLRAEFYGQAGDDYLCGGAFGDLLVGGAGRDTLIGGSLGGNDELWGDDFDPLLESRDHWSRRVAATDGPDSLTTYGGDDQLYGQGGNDTIGAGGGNDYVSGGLGDDKISGNDGDDRLYGNDGNDTIAGDGGNDLLAGGAGDDLLLGRLGNDVLIGGDGADQLHGHEGNDLLVAGRLKTEPGPNAESTAAGDASDAAMLALLLEWSTLGRATGIGAEDDGALDWLYGYAGSDRFLGDGSQRNYDFVAGVDALG